MAPVARFSGRLRGSSLFDPFALDMWSPFEGSPRSGGGGGAGTTFSAGPGPDGNGTGSPTADTETVRGSSGGRRQAPERASSAGEGSSSR
ncbi:unnamed protein product [Spirodela intermedia]|uniref:Uncharacterized protein n=1 Tax=Spirodela intermedia TaxID=51605 RepID=A0A7I8LIN1_SPIIN|nr:unnamed protein product [Spirodela intermedia]